MRRYALLAMMLTLPAVAAAQGSPGDGKRRPGGSATQPAASGVAKTGQPSTLRQQLELDSLDSGADAAASKESQKEEAVDDKLPLAAKLYLTDNPAAFQKAWRSNASALPTASRIGPANPVMAMILVSGCKRGKDGKCNLTFTSRTAGPDGQFDQPRTSPPWKPAPMGNKQELAPASFGLRLGPGDPAGRYTVEVRVNDLVADSNRTLTAAVTKPAAAAEGR